MSEQLYSISVFKWKSGMEKPVMLTSKIDVSSFGYFQRTSAKEFIVFVSRNVTKNTPPGTRQQCVQDDYRVYVHLRADGLACVVAANQHYPGRVAFTLCSQILTEFSEKFQGKWENATDDGSCEWSELEGKLAKYQNPAEADKILKIQKDLEDVKTLMMQNLDKVLERGDKIEDLVDKSDDLGKASKTFYKSAKKANNRCCVVM